MSVNSHITEQRSRRDELLGSLAGATTQELEYALAVLVTVRTQVAARAARTRADEAQIQHTAAARREADLKEELA